MLVPEQEPEPKYGLGEYVNDGVCDSFCVGRDPARNLAQGEEDGVQDPEHDSVDGQLGVKC